ncbi:glycerophosphodiester phosphodiesterase [Georgenia sp. Z1491]|uniref:glycerophosphodiester phosphodiesterase n=1 Tax=Georgenia sp. Z1491 TaxID=3416707 RepID=UPI003CEE5D28
MPRIDARAGSGPEGGAADDHLEVLGHRGASAERRENTLPAFVRAVEVGADGVELDTHLSADGVPVVRHDLLIGRRATRELTADELGRLGVPTLVAALDAIEVAAGDAGSDPWVLVEIKSAPDGSLPCATPREVVAAVGQVLAGRSGGPGCVLESFDRAVLAAAAELLPALPRAVLADGPSTAAGSPFLGPATEAWGDPDPVAAARALGALAIAPRHTWLGPELASRAREAGLETWAWTVNSVTRAARVRALGASVVITDDPARMVPALHPGRE